MEGEAGAGLLYVAELICRVTRQAWMKLARRSSIQLPGGVIIPVIG